MFLMFLMFFMFLVFLVFLVPTKVFVHILTFNIVLCRMRRDRESVVVSTVH